MTNIAAAAKMILEVLDLNEEAEELMYLLSTKHDQVSELQDELQVLAKRAQENKETALRLKRAEHKEEMAQTRKAHADLAVHLITAHVEKELKALGATDALLAFRAKREQRRQDVANVFGCHKDHDNGERLRKATKRRQDFHDNESRDEERKIKRSAELQLKWAEQWYEVVEKKKEKNIRTLQHEKTIAEEEERAKEPKPVPRMVKNKRTFTCRQEMDLWWATYFWNQLITTDAHEEVDIPQYGCNEPTRTEDRHYPSNWEKDRPEQMGTYVIRPPIEVITLD